MDDPRRKIDRKFQTYEDDAYMTVGDHINALVECLKLTAIGCAMFSPLILVVWMLS
jgi:hypothetical protein